MIARRDVLKAGAAAAAVAALPTGVFAAPYRFREPAASFAPVPAGWRRFDMVTKVEVLQPKGVSQAWIPMPAIETADWQRPLGSSWTTNAGSATLVTDASGAQLLHVTWAEGTPAPVVEITNRVATRDRRADLATPGTAAPLDAATRARYLAPSALIPTDGIVKETSDRITAGARTDVEKVRAIYEWMVVNTFRNGPTRGCGEGDVVAILKSGTYGGKCADLNGMFVGMVRAAGVPARDLYGVRVAASKFGYKSLGANSETITKAQHCRAEVFLDGQGWVAMDPADVRKVMLEERPEGLKLDAPQVVAARQTLFGSWEGNWVAYNDGHDVTLPGSKQPKIGFLMYPQVETAAARGDCYDPDTVKYTITSKEVAA